MLTIILLSALILTGCEDNTPASLTNEAQSWASRANLALTEMEDQTFALSLRKEADLIGGSMDKNRKVSVNIFCLSGDELTYFPATKNGKLTHINDSWRSIATSQIICNVAESEYNVTIHKDDKTWEVVGATLTWETHDIFGETTWSVLDCDNDGYWDFISHDNLVTHAYAGSTSDPDRVLFSYSKWGNICLEKNTEVVKISSNDTLSQLELLI